MQTAGSKHCIQLGKIILKLHHPIRANRVLRWRQLIELSQKTWLEELGMTLCSTRESEPGGEILQERMR